MSINVLAFGLGAILLLTGILGGGIQVKEITIPQVSLKVRVAAILVGCFFLALGVVLSKPELIKPPTAENANSSEIPTPGTDKYGAIAFSESTRNYGYGTDYSTREEAERWALYDCKAPDAKIILSFSNGCVALTSGKNRRIGKAQANTKAEAERLALAECAEKDQDCKILYSECTSH
jgi:hypothetical protein